MYKLIMRILVISSSSTSSITVSITTIIDTRGWVYSKQALDCAQVDMHHYRVLNHVLQLLAQEYSDSSGNRPWSLQFAVVDVARIE